MTKDKMRSIAVVAVMSVGAATTLAGCFEPGVGGCSTAAVAGVAVVVGNRANSPTPEIPSALDDLLRNFIKDSRHTAKNDVATIGVNVIAIDGRPAISCVVKLNVKTENKAAEDDAERRFRDDIRTAVSQARAKTDEADVLGALTLAAGAVGTGGTIVLVDSGLQTVAPLSFVEPNLVGAEPDQVLERLGKLTPLPDLTGRTVILSGIGYTALPQQPLHEGQRQLLVRLWEALVRRAGARDVTVVPQPNTSESGQGLPRVTEVPVPDVGTVRIACDTTFPLQNDGAVGFVPKETTFLDEPAARRALTDLANFLVRNRDARITLTGNVAHYGNDNGLSYRRALAVRNLLVELGAPGGRIQAVGDGWGPYPSKNAGPDPAFDQKNRRVLVAVSCG